MSWRKEKPKQEWSAKPAPQNDHTVPECPTLKAAYISSSRLGEGSPSRKGNPYCSHGKTTSLSIFRFRLDSL